MRPHRAVKSSAEDMVCRLDDHADSAPKSVIGVNTNVNVIV